MQLNLVLEGEKETKEDYFERTYWVGGNYNQEGYVFVWNDKKEKDDPRMKATEKLSLSDARRYVKTLPERFKSDGEKGEQNGN